MEIFRKILAVIAFASQYCRYCKELKSDTGHKRCFEQSIEDTMVEIMNSDAWVDKMRAVREKYSSKRWPKI